MFGKKKRSTTRKKRSLFKKIIRFFLFTLATLFTLIVAALFIIPAFFTDDIANAVRDEINESIDAELFMKGEEVELSLWSNFPNATLEMGHFGVVGKGEFEGDTLLSTESFKVEIDLWSLFGDKFKINGIYLEKPLIQVLVNKNGKANYDIAIPDTTATEEVVEEEAPAEGGGLAYGIDHWEITDGRIKYDDRQANTYLEIMGFQHSGNGDFALETMDLETSTEFAKFIVEDGGITYFPGNYFKFDMILGISEAFQKFEFKDNRLQLNEFVTEFGGIIQLTEEGTNFDNFVLEAKETEFKNILSLVPGVYTESFDQLKTSGTMGFKTTANGSLTETTIPAFNFNLNVGDATFQYPDLPSSISKINVDLGVENTDGILDNTNINLADFSMMMGNNPISAKAIIKGLADMDIDANAKVKLNLADLTSIYPIEGINLKGIFGLDANAKGKYNESGALPAVAAKMSMDKGFVKAKGFDKALEDLSFDSKLSMPSTALSDGSFDLNSFSMIMDEDEFNAEFHVQDFEAINFKGGFNGLIDLDKIMAMFPMEGMELGGKFNVEELSTEGNLAAIEEERYGDIPTSGTVTIDGFKYFDELLIPGPITVDEGTMKFGPKDLELSGVKGMISKSDYSAYGSVKNYMGYVFDPVDTVLKADLVFNSNTFDLNEWMYEEEVPTLESTEAALADITDGTVEGEDLEVYPLPRNLDVKLQSSIKDLKYSYTPMQNLTGVVRLNDGIAYMDNIRFKMFGGGFIADGYYSTQDPKKQLYAFDIDIDKLQFKDAYVAFDIAKKFLPQAKDIVGSFSSKFKMSGSLGSDYMPLFDDLNMDGVFDIHEATSPDSKLMAALNKVGHFKKQPNEIKIENTTIKAEIEDGYVSFRPFSFKAGNLPMEIQGKSGLAGDIEYTVGTEVPSGAMGQAFNNKLSSLGVNHSVGDKIKMDFGVTGTHTKPHVKLLTAGGQDVKNQIESVAKEKLQEELKNACDDIKPEADKIDKDAEAEADKIRKDGQAEAKKIRDQGKTSADSLRAIGDAEYQKIMDDAEKEAAAIEKQKTLNPQKIAENKLKAKGIRAAGQKAADAAKNTAYKQATNVENKSNSLANKTEDTADDAADKILNTASKKIEKLMKKCD